MTSCLRQRQRREKNPFRLHAVYAIVDAETGIFAIGPHGPITFDTRRNAERWVTNLNARSTRVYRVEKVRD